MLEVYNHLISTYHPKFKNYSTSVRNNTKNVYKNILAINRHSPLFKLDLTNERQSFALNLKDAALSLKYHLEDLSDGETSAFSSREVKSQNPDVADATVSNAAAVKTLPEETSLFVHQLAKPQINQGYEVPASQASGMSGQYSFIINIDDNSYEYQFNIAEGSTNELIFMKLSDFINKSQVGINASVVKEKENGSLTFTMASASTGSVDDSIFTIEDSGKPEGKIGLIQYYGLDRMIQAPANAIVEINGNQKEILNNKFTLYKSLKITLKEPSSEPVLIQTVPDKNKILNMVSQTIDTYNSLIDLAASQTGNRRSLKLQHELNNIVKNNSIQLNECGISVADSLHLQIDEKKAAHAIESHAMEVLFSVDSTFLDQLNSAADIISLNPMDYLDKVVVTYPNTSVPGFYSPYTTSIYSGMLFNYYC